MKLYWRVKIDGRWTWRRAIVHGWTNDGAGGHIVDPYLSPKGARREHGNGADPEPLE